MRRIADWWFAPAPAARLAAVRILVGTYALVYVLVRLPELAAVAHLPARDFEPVGVTRVLVAPLPAWLSLALVGATIAALVAFAAGVRWRIVAPIAAALLLWTTTYRNAWGMTFHTENLFVLHVIALAWTPAADAYALGARPGAPRAPAAGYGWGLKLLAALTAATYVLAGVAKLRLGGMGWIDGELLRNQIAVDNLRKALLGEPTAPLATPLLQHSAWFSIVSVATLVLELGAPLALLGGRLARGWVLAAWGFHAGVILLMNVWFPYPVIGFAYLPLLHAERVIEAPRDWWRRRRARREIRG